MPLRQSLPSYANYKTATGLIYPDNFEKKIGFDAIRIRLKELCGSVLGRENVDAMAFGNDFEVISGSLRLTAEMLSIANGSDPLPLRNLHDVTGALKRCRVEGAAVGLDELLRIRQSLQTISDIYDYFNRGDSSEEKASACPELCNLCSGLIVFPEITRQIDRVIDHLGNVRDNASAYLAEIRSELSKVSSSVNSIMRRVISQAVTAGYLEKDVTPTVRDGRLVLPVAPMHKRKINGIVHDESATGKTYFIEPAEIVEINNRARELEMEERREILRILAELTSTMRPYIPEMLGSYAIMGQLDFIMAKALYARDTDATMPHLSNDTELEWYHATHPVLLESLRRHGKEIVPLDITLTPRSRILVISGPNAGGKSVCLKTVGIVQYMTQCGMLPTVYENSHIGIFNDIFIDIGDDQSIEDDLSTYSSHLRNMKFMLQRGRKSTLFLIDEMGSGTEPQIGGALAQAILAQMNAEGLWGIVTTHYQNLKQMADDTPGLVNGSMLYDRQLMQPLFKLSIGNPGSSFAVEIARKIGLPKDIIDSAEQIVGSDYINLDKYLLDITRDKRYWENKRRKEKMLDEKLERYTDDAETLRARRREILDEAKAEAKRILESSNAAIERTIAEIKKANAERELTLEARRRLKEERLALESNTDGQENSVLARAPKKKKTKHSIHSSTSSGITRQVEAGCNVKLDGQGTVGTVLEVSGKNAIVAFGNIKTTVKTERLTVTDAKPKEPKKSGISMATIDAGHQRQLQFKHEIDVRGFRADEAVQAVTYFIDDAIRFNAPRVRILHGTGTGVLRQVIRDYLSTVPGVMSSRDEDVRFGGAGITVVELQ